MLHSPVQSQRTFIPYSYSPYNSQAPAVTATGVRLEAPKRTPNPIAGIRASQGHAMKMPIYSFPSAEVTMFRSAARCRSPPPKSWPVNPMPSTLEPRNTMNEAPRGPFAQ